MLGEVEAKSLEKGIQLQSPERNVCCLTLIINPLLTGLVLFLRVYRPLPPDGVRPTIAVHCGC